MAKKFKLLFHSPNMFANEIRAAEKEIAECEKELKPLVTIESIQAGVVGKTIGITLTCNGGREFRFVFPQWRRACGLIAQLEMVTKAFIK